MPRVSGIQSPFSFLVLRTLPIGRANFESVALLDRGDVAAVLGVVAGLASRILNGNVLPRANQNSVHGTAGVGGSKIDAGNARADRLVHLSVESIIQIGPNFGIHVEVSRGYKSLIKPGFSSNRHIMCLPS